VQEVMSVSYCCFFRSRGPGFYSDRCWANTSKICDPIFETAKFHVVGSANGTYFCFKTIFQYFSTL